MQSDERGGIGMNWPMGGWGQGRILRLVASGEDEQCASVLVAWADDGDLSAILEAKDHGGIAAIIFFFIFAV